MDKIILHKKLETTVDRNTRRRMQCKSVNLRLEVWRSLKARANETGIPMLQLIEDAWNDYDRRIVVEQHPQENHDNEQK